MDEWHYQPARDLGLTTGQRLHSLQRETGLLALTTRCGWWSITAAYLAVCHRLCVRGRDRLPACPPFVLVANHTSHLDVLALALALSWRVRTRLLVIAAGDTFFKSPLVATFSVGALNALPIWRDHCGANALRQLRRRLVEEPCVYILFPEGTRSRTGTMAPFKAGLGMLVAGSGVPVVPCHLSGAYEALPPHRRWPRPHPLELCIGRPLIFDHVPNRRQGWAQVATETEAAVQSLAESSEKVEAAPKDAAPHPPLPTPRRSSQPRPPRPATARPGAAHRLVG